MSSGRRGGAPALALLVAIAVTLPSGCRRRERSGTAGGGRDQRREAIQTECQALHYPCTWAEVDTAVLRRTDQLGVGAAVVMRETGSVERVADWLRAAPGVAELQTGEIAVRFRPRGGRPVWIFAPSDSAHPRLGGHPGRRRARPPISPSAGRAASAVRAAAVPADLFPARRAAMGVTGVQFQQEGHARHGIAAKRGPGTPKRALILSPFEYEPDRDAGDVANGLATAVRDYQEKRGGSVTYHANLTNGAANPTTKPPPDQTRVSGEVSLSDFLGWSAYSFIYVSTHGGEVCQSVIPVAHKPCHTVLDAGQVLGAAALDVGQALGPDATLAWAVAALPPGVSLSYDRADLNPGLDSGERAVCVQAMQNGWEVEGIQKQDDGDFETTGGKVCIVNQHLRAVEVMLSTEFFRIAYRHGLENVVLFLSACETMKAYDLPDVFTHHGLNQNVAVLGYTGIVYTDVASQIGRAAVRIMGAFGLSERDFVRHIRTEFFLQGLTGVAMSTDVGGTTSGRAVERSSNPTHARDVVELVDPISGEELEDAGSVWAVGAPKDGKPDSVRVTMRVRGIDKQTRTDDIAVFLLVNGKRGERMKLARPVSDYVWAVARNTFPLGIDVSPEQTIDLEIRAVLEGGGESRWSYHALRLKTLSGEVTYSGRWEGGYAAGYKTPPNLTVSTGTQPFPTACSITLWLYSEDRADLVVIGGHLPPPLKLGRLAIEDVSTRGAGEPGLGMMALQARPACGHFGADCSAGLPVAQSRGGIFEVTRLDGDVLEGRFQAPIGDATGAPHSVVEGRFVARLGGLGGARLPADHPCRPR